MRFFAFVLTSVLLFGCAVLPLQSPKTLMKAQLGRSQCSKPKLALTNGIKGLEAKFPGVVLVLVPRATETSYCTGTVVQKDEKSFWVLTAAHCVVGAKDRKLSLRDHETTLLSSYVHPLFKLTDKEVVDGAADISGYDVAFLHFRGSIPVEAMPLARTIARKNDAVVLAGFGGYQGIFKNDEAVSYTFSGPLTGRYGCNQVETVWPSRIGDPKSFVRNGMLEISGTSGSRESATNGGDGVNASIWRGDSGSPLFEAEGPVKDCRDVRVKGITGVASYVRKNKENGEVLGGYINLLQPCVSLWVAQVLGTQASGERAFLEEGVKGCGFAVDSKVLPRLDTMPVLVGDSKQDLNSKVGIIDFNAADVFQDMKASQMTGKKTHTGSNEADQNDDESGC